ncbi:SAT4 [Cyberlindnera jadinii]|uniref:non-specific serine/threonine protein kinase n=1 Tax=Cyberlindnera jadinii (strain ATCC 18201 / CBS 1600 / BCRC 20928 / JCM 3617 / NBRC 0987 / NRRL Y-1542) TaxID=983966 RepID=A0A0H5BZ94_CYBJN|nr:SAT4 [Cyberlindnera jadinii]
MAAEGNRPRKSTLSKIGKMFGVSSASSSVGTTTGQTPTSPPTKALQQTTSPLAPLAPQSPLQQQAPPPAQQQQQGQQTDHEGYSTSSSMCSSLNNSHLDLSSLNNKKSPVMVPPIQELKIDEASDLEIDSYSPPPPKQTVPSRSPSIRVENGASKNIQVSRTASINSSMDKEKDKSKQFVRFVINEDGTHVHHLTNNKRQEKLSKMLRNLLQSSKIRDEAVSTVPDLMQSGPPSLFANLVKDYQGDQDNPFSGATTVKVPNGDSPSSGQIASRFPAPNWGNGTIPMTSAVSNKSLTFAERYGKCQETVGKGTFGVVRVAHKRTQQGVESLYAIKEFKRRPGESDNKYSRRLTSEFCISSSLKHVNIIETLDLLQDAKGDYVEVMEYCSGGDLYTLIIAAGKLEYVEADCFFKQLMRGVNYMHSMGVAHRDLKPENLLLTDRGTLKITDFGNGECFRMAWEKEVHMSGGICGSSPYIAPEEYTSEEFDPRSVDIWACGVIYMAMRTGRHLWRTATQDDEFYVKYLEGRKVKEGYEPIEQIKRSRCRNVIYSILDPVPSRRINGKQILMSEWGREIKCCVEVPAHVKVV